VRTNASASLGSRGDVRFQWGLKLNPEQIAAEYETVADKPTWFGSTIAFPRTIKL